LLTKIYLWCFAVAVLGTGTYKITATVDLTDGSQMTCLEISVEIVA
jgi:hypothetical protein